MRAERAYGRSHSIWKKPGKKTLKGLRLLAARWFQRLIASGIRSSWRGLTMAKASGENRRWNDTNGVNPRLAFGIRGRQVIDWNSIGSTLRQYQNYEKSWRVVLAGREEKRGGTIQKVFMRGEKIGEILGKYRQGIGLAEKMEKSMLIARGAWFSGKNEHHRNCLIGICGGKNKGRLWRR